MIIDFTIPLLGKVLDQMLPGKRLELLVYLLVYQALSY
jgi:hypothetical protein